jgi:hypothetical protein
VRFEVLTAVKSMFWVVTPSRLVDLDTLQGFSPEDGGRMFLRNAGTHLRVKTQKNNTVILDVFSNRIR